MSVGAVTALAWASLAWTVAARQDQILPRDRRVERALAVGDEHAWTIGAQPGEFVDIAIEQRDIDIAATVVDPSGTTVGTYDTPNGDLDAERVRFLTSTVGRYRVTVRAIQPEAEPGRYAIRLQSQRAASETDRRVAAAIAAHAEADRLRADPATRAESLAAYDRAIARWREAEDPAGEANALRAKGFAYVRLRDDASAYETFSRTREMWRGMKDVRSEAFSLLILGTIHTRRNEPAETRARALEALPLWRRSGDRGQEAFTLGEIGTTYARQRDRPGTERWYRDALSVARKKGRPTLEAAVLDNFARAYSLLEDQSSALATYERARAQWRKGNNRRGQAASWRAMGMIHETRGNKSKAVDAYLRAADLWRDAGLQQEEAADRARADRLRGP